MTLQPTALVHEAFLRLIGQNRVDWKGRAHFLGIAATMMRRILVDRARARAAAKRGAAPGLPIAPLASLDPQQARLVELRYFGGLTIDETAAALDISSATVERDWRTARAFLRRELRGAASA